MPPNAPKELMSAMLPAAAVPDKKLVAIDQNTGEMESEPAQVTDSAASAMGSDEAPT
jgi:hypothetical protein